MERNTSMTKQANGKSKRVVLHVDFGDQLLLSKEQQSYYGRERMRRLFDKCAEAGVTEIFWRVSMIGAANWPSAVRYQLNDPLAAQIEFNEPSVHPFTTIAEQYARVLKEGDPLGMAVDAAHERGLRFFAYVTLFDESYPGAESRFVQEHPETCWQHRYLKHKTIRGLLSYAEPAVVEYRLLELDELLAYPVDGIYYDTARTHCGVWDIYPLPFGEYSPYLSYGFNPIESQEYANRYGVDPRLSSLADAVLPQQMSVLTEGNWDRLRGEYLTSYLAKASEKIRRSNKRLAVGFYTDDATYLSPAGQRGRAPMGRFHHDWQAWWRERLIDEIVLIAGDHRRFGADDWQTHSGVQFSKARKEGLSVLLWGATEYRIDDLPNALKSNIDLPIHIKSDRDLFLRKTHDALRHTFEQDAEGIFLHEAWDVEKYDYFDTIRRAIGESTG